MSNINDMVQLKAKCCGETINDNVADMSNIRARNTLVTEDVQETKDVLY